MTPELHGDPETIKDTDMPDTPEPFITPAETARLAAVTHRAVGKWLHRYPALGFKVMGRWRVRPDVLDLILAGKAPPSDAVAHHDSAN
jgi:hypothetical protein